MRKRNQKQTVADVDDDNASEMLSSIIYKQLDIERVGMWDPTDLRM